MIILGGKRMEASPRDCPAGGNGSEAGEGGVNPERVDGISEGESEGETDESITDLVFGEYFV